MSAVEYEYAVRFADGSVDDGFTSEASAREFFATAQRHDADGREVWKGPELVRRPVGPDVWEPVE